MLTNTKFQQILQLHYRVELVGPSFISRVTDMCDDVRPQALYTAPKGMNRKTATGTEIRLRSSYFHSVYRTGKCVTADTHQRTDGSQKITGDLGGETKHLQRKYTFR